MAKRKGRKRKSTVAREKNGRALRVATAEDAMAVALAQPHRKGLENPKDDRAESELGRLLLAGLLTRPQYRAGNTWRQIVVRQRRALDAPCGHPTGVLAGLLGGRGGGGDMGSEQAAEARVDYADADHAMRSGFRPLDAREIARVVNTVAVDGYECGDLFRLRLGLDALSAHFESRTPARSGIARQHAEIA